MEHTAGSCISWAYKKAIEQCHKTTALHPQFPAGHVMLALAYEADGLYREALDAFHTSYDLQPSPIALSGIGHVYGRMGKKPSAERVLKQLKVMSNSGQTAMSQYFYGLVYAGLGDTGEALSCLQQAYRERFDWMAYLPVDPRWDVLHNESRFIKELLRKLGLYDFWQRKAN